MKRAFIWILIFSSLLWAEEKRVLHLSAWPPHSEVYVENVPADFSNRPDYTTPADISIPLGEETILVTLFQKDFRDTTIEVSIPKIPKSHLMVILQEESDAERLYYQEEALKKRTRKNIGSKIMLGSLLPFALSLASLALNAYEKEEADSIRKDLKDHHIESEATSKAKKDWNAHKRRAKNYRWASLGCAGAGVSFLAVGLYLRF